MKLDRDQLIRRVAEKHKVILGDDDPILATLALHDVIMEHYTSLFDAAVGRLEQAVVGTTAANTAVLKQQTTTTLGQAIYGLRKVIDDGARQLEAAVTKVPVQQPVQVSRQEAVHVQPVTMTWAVLFMACALVVLLAAIVLRH